jgi:hypothetical protein
MEAARPPKPVNEQREACAVVEVSNSRSRTVELLELSAEPACWRKYGGIGAQPTTLKPDSYARLGVGTYEDSYFIEIDMGTEGSRAL